MTTRTELGEALRTRRKELGLRQMELAELAGVSDRTLRDLERGTTGTSLDAVLAVARALGLDVSVGVRRT